MTISDVIVPNKGTKVTNNANKKYSELNKFGRTLFIDKDKSIEDYKLFYIGAESLTLTNLMMTFNKCEFCTYNPDTRIGRMESVNVNRMLMKRYYMVERAKDAKIVGIIAGTLGVTEYLKVMERLRKMIHMAGKKSYTFVMGKLNAPKMANFMEVKESFGEYFYSFYNDLYGQGHTKIMAIIF